jgi:hypothetical protein
VRDSGQPDGDRVISPILEIDRDTFRVQVRRNEIANVRIDRSDPGPCNLVAHVTRWQTAIVMPVVSIDMVIP